MDSDWEPLADANDGALVDETGTVPQSRPMRDDQVLNKAGGYVFEVTPMTHLKRFIILGSDSCVFYASARQLTLDAAKSIVKLLDDGHGLEMVQLLFDYSISGRTAKQDYLIFALAICAKFGNDEVKAAVYAKLPEMCRIPTTLFMFCEYVKSFADPKPLEAPAAKINDDAPNAAAAENSGVSEQKQEQQSQEKKDVNMTESETTAPTAVVAAPKKKYKAPTHHAPRTGKNWGKGQRRAIAKWYNQPRGALALARLITKYKNRSGWTHKDLLRCAHVKPASPALSLVFKYAINGWTAELEKALAEMVDVDPDCGKIKNYFGVQARLTQLDRDYNELAAAAKAAHAKGSGAEFVAPVVPAAMEAEIVQAIRTYRLEREHMPTAFLNSAAIWAALTENLGLTALLRNLNKLSTVGLLDDDRQENKARVDMIVEQVTNVDVLKRARMHPFNVLTTLLTYQSGRGARGSLSWPVNRRIVNALEQAYYLSFKAVVPTGKRYLVAIDVSGSMGWSNVMNSAVMTSRDAAAALAMTLVRTEEKCDVVAFTTTLTPFPLSKDDTLSDVQQRTANMPFGGTDCAQPMVYAKQERKSYDAFVVLTDNETWYGSIHPAEALRQYRAAPEFGVPDAKLAVIAFQASDRSIADPKDPGMMDMVGFDSSGPEVLRSFVMGELSG
ncbi:60 kDa SS-A/Ro ribonucleoprotein [Allomyces arbusculus]|nr:60 kDa SS-A/Ro ribonucleoprotein [Allomyces arbusculus]